MREMRQDRLAFDLQSARTIDPLSGHMHVSQTNISKATDNEYLGSEIPGYKALGLEPTKTYKLLRDPNELEAAAKSFNGKPLVMVHREQAVDDADHQNRVGSVYNAKYEHPYLKADLAVLDRPAIDAIETGDQRELSCGYGYKPDMTPGEYEGQKFDGVMRQLGGNHVALVREGRAGPDCYVFDSIDILRGTSMTKTVLSRKAVAAQGALVAYLAPKMAKDAKIDWTPTFKDITSKNFKDKQATIAQDVLKQVKGKLAKDEDVNLEKVAEIIEAIASVEPTEPEVVDTVAPPVRDPNDPAMDDDDEDLVKKLVAKGYGEEEAKRIAARTPAPAAADGDDPDKDKDKDKDDKKAMDELRQTIAAMDAKIEKARRDGAADATKTQREIREAEKTVRPHVGELSVAMDSAAAVYRAALMAMDIEDAKSLPEAALIPVFKQAVAGREAAKRPRMAQDAATDVRGFNERYPDAAHIRQL